MNMEDAVGAYVKLRDKAAAITAEADGKVKLLKEGMSKLEAFFKTEADKQGVTSFRTPHGTAFLSTVDFAGVENWDALLEHIKTKDAYNMLNKAVNKIAVREYIDQHKQVPPGVSYGTKLTVGVRKPGAKAD